MLKKSRILFAFMPFMLVSCGAKECVAHRARETYIAQKKTDSSKQYIIMNYSLSFVDSGSKQLTKKDFSATKDNQKIEAACLVSSPTFGTQWTYENELDSVTVTNNFTYLYVGFAVDSGVDNTCKFFCKSFQILTENTIIKI